MPGFTCIHVRRSQSWKSLWPNDQDRDLVMRINRLNISLYPGLLIAVPNHLAGQDAIDFAPFPKSITPPKEKVIIVDPNVLAFGAYNAAGRLVYWGPISAGSNYCRDLGTVCHTHSGTFRVFTLGEKSCYSHKFPLPRGGAPMPYCMYFNHGQALHGEPNGLPGYNASHGCVRLLVEDAAWLRFNFVDGPNAGNTYQGTRVTIRSY
ncbi:MAG: enhanced entry protein EnhA [uncultured bacterium]|nr:MAG: enhanced entry protein EnhA [uncultured bacterium]